MCVVSGWVGYLRADDPKVSGTIGISLHFGNNETRKRKEQRIIFKLGTLAPNGINEDFYSLNFKHIFDQLDATNFNQLQNLTFRSAKVYNQLFKH